MIHPNKDIVFSKFIVVQNDFSSKLSAFLSKTKFVFMSIHDILNLKPNKKVNNLPKLLYVNNWLSESYIDLDVIYKLFDKSIELMLEIIMVLPPKIIEDHKISFSKYKNTKLIKEPFILENLYELNIIKHQNTQTYLFPENLSDSQLLCITEIDYLNFISKCIIADNGDNFSNLGDKFNLNYIINNLIKKDKNIVKYQNDGDGYDQLKMYVLKNYSDSPTNKEFINSVNNWFSNNYYNFTNLKIS